MQIEEDLLGIFEGKEKTDNLAPQPSFSNTRKRRISPPSYK